MVKTCQAMTFRGSYTLTDSTYAITKWRVRLAYWNPRSLNPTSDARKIASARRQGQWMHHKLSEPKNPVVAAILHKTLHHLRQLPEMKRDHEMLKNTCCRPERFAVHEPEFGETFRHQFEELGLAGSVSRLQPALAICPG